MTNYQLKMIAVIKRKIRLTDERLNGLDGQDKETARELRLHKWRLMNSYDFYLTIPF